MNTETDLKPTQPELVLAMPAFGSRVLLFYIEDRENYDPETSSG
jgi:hypothetical protein